MSDTRKRHRSEEETHGLQSKCFVNQHIVEKSNSQLMTKVYEKTLNMIYAGARNQIKISQNKTNNNRNGEKNKKEIGAETQKDAKDISSHVGCKCKLCWKDVDASSKLCKNCTLKICERCQTTCVGCKAALCVNCVNLFGCLIQMDNYNNGTPICEECKIFMDS